MKNKVILTLVLSIITIVLATTRLGYIPVPTAANWATVMHVPAIIGGILGGWLIGVIIGGVFGLTAILVSIADNVPIFADPWVSLPPRMCIGVVAYFVFIWVKNINEYMGVVIAAVMGTFTNSFLVLSVAVIKGYMDTSTAFKVGLTHGVPELIVASIVTLVVIAGYWFIRDKYLLS